MKIISIVWAILLSFCAISAPLAESLNKVVVFGDSLSDNGNFYEYMKHEMPLSPPYYQGRFTNGPNWVELLTQHYYPNDYQSHLLDYAFGGSGVLGEDGDFDDDTLFTLSQQIDSYLLAHQDKADGNSLFVVWMGSNNYLAIPDDVDKEIKNVNWGITHSLQHLAEKGAKHILVINIPDLGKTPAARDFDAENTLSYASLTHNAVIEKSIEQLKIDNPGIQWLFFDVNQMLMDMLTSPETYGFTNVTDTCYEEMVSNPSSKSILHMVATVKPKAHMGQDACTGYLFFDPVHPSEAAHIVMAKRISDLLDKEHIAFE